MGLGLELGGDRCVQVAWAWVGTHACCARNEGPGRHPQLCCVGALPCGAQRCLGALLTCMRGVHVVRCVPSAHRCGHVQVHVVVC